MIPEWSQTELIEHAAHTDRSFAVLLYTPFCGTCKLTERMLDIVLVTDPAIPLYKSNINFMPIISRDWQITSVPCIVIIHDDQTKEFLYSMKSIDELYKKLKPLG
ncbi:Thioredoxin [compost metagenome]